MRDLRQDVDGLSHLIAPAESGRGARVIMFMSARSSEGTGSVAVAFARIAAARMRHPVWLVDLDLQRNPQYTAFARGALSGAGRPGHALDASLGTGQIYVVAGHERDPACAKLLHAHQIDGERLIVTRFRSDRLPQSASVRLKTAPDWWKVLRTAAGGIVVDAPGLDASDAGLQVAPQADGVVLVIQANATPATEVVRLRHAIEALGGKILGVVLNRA